MPELTSIPAAELAELKERLSRLGREKAQLQLIALLMNRLSELPGLERTVEGMLQFAMDILGGLNVTIYYRLDDAIHCVDVHGRKEVVGEIDDDLVRQAFETREFVSRERDFSLTGMMTNEFTKATTWVMPLLVGTELVGVLRMDDLLVAGRELRDEVQTFLRYASLVLKNEISGEKRLRRALDEVDRATRAEAALAAQHSTLRGIIEGTTSPIFSVDREYRYVAFNQSHASAMKALYGAETEVGRSLLDDISVAGDREKAKEDLDRALAGERLVESPYLGGEAGPKKCFEISHHPVRSDDGEVVGVAVFAADVTDRRRAEQEIRDSEEKFAAAFRASPSLMALTRITDGTILEVNDGYTRLLGYSRAESVGRTTSELSIWGDGSDRDAFIARLSECGEVTDFETTLRRKDGTLVEVLDSARTIELQGGRCVLSVVHDVSERKRTERRLHSQAESGSLLLDVFLRSPHLSEMGVLDEVLSLAVRLTGSAVGFLHRVSDDEKTAVLTTWSLGALEGSSAASGTETPIDDAGNRVADLRRGRPVICNDGPASRDLRFLAAGHAALRRFMSVPVIEGGRIRVIFSVGNKTDEYDDGDVVQVQQIANELQKIIEQRRAAQRVVFLNRLYRTISEMNQVIVREKDRDRLFAEVCRIGVEHGRFAMVWAGLADLPGGIVHPVAAAGVEARYVDELDLRLDAPEDELRPAARAVLEDRVVVVDDTEIDPEFTPWREAARLRGFRSCAAFPVHAGGVVSGVLKVYAGEAGVLHGEVAALLVELAADLGYALHALETGERRTQAELALRSSESSLKEAQRISHLGNWDLDLERNVLTWSDEIYRIFELDPGRFGASYEAFLDGVHPDDRAFVDQAYVESVRTRTPYDIVHRLLMPDGRVKYVNERCETFYDDDGRPLRSLGTVQDITQRRRAELELARANRALRMLSDTNQALIRITEEPALLAEVCRIAVDVGGYRMAWVGFAEEDEAKTLRPAANAGLDAGYLASANLTWADVERGRGPGGTAIRTGRPCIVRSIPTDRAFAPWRDAAIERGYKSIIVLPLVGEGRAFGVLGIYAGEEDAFDSREVEILKELTGDLAFGITALRTRTERGRLARRIQADLHFFESMDQVNRGIQAAGDLDQMMNETMETVLSTFGCDRAWLFYPCDPKAPSFRVPMEVARAEYPGAKVLNVDVPMPPDMAGNLREALESAGPLTYAVGTERPINRVSAEQFGVQSMMLTALRPRSGKPWAFGIHQCSSARIWTSEEKRLFQEIGRRLTDALTSLLTHRDLKESEAKYRRIVDTATEGIWVLGRDALTTFVNARMAGMVGCSREEMIGRPVTDFLFEEEAADHLRMMEDRFRGLPERYECRFRRKDGQAVWTVASATPILDDERRFGGSFAMFTDITERKGLEEGVRRLNVELESRVEERTAELAEAIKELESFSYSVSHDLRAPLRAIDGFSSLLETQSAGGLDEEGRRLLQTIRRNAHQMGRLIDDLLRFSRSSRAELLKATIDMNALVEQILADLLPAAERDRTEIRVAKLPAAWGDAGLVRVVLQNLLSNALKYSAPRERRLVEIGSRPAGAGPEYFIRDNGVGFDPRYVNKLFGVFQRLHSAAEFEGTGIGLALVRRIVNRHGGRVWAEGAVGHGATFWFTLGGAGSASGGD